jgi:hypothetical protein
MPHSGDRLVDAKAILEALSDLERPGNKIVMAELEYWPAMPWRN